MPQGRKSNEWIHNELRDARRCLNEGQVLLENESEAGALARIYYGLFHAAQAAVGMTKPCVSNQHRNTEQELEQSVIFDAGVPFTKHDLQFYSDLRKARGRVEYRDHPPQVERDLEQTYGEVRAIIEDLERYADAELHPER